MRNLSLFFAALFITLTACSTAKVLSNQQVDVRNDKYQDVATVTTSTYQMENGADVMLRSFIPKTSATLDTSEYGVSQRVEADAGDPIYQLYFQVTANQWHYWDEARYLVNGNRKALPMEQIATDVSCSSYGCTHYEDAITSVSRSDLETIQQNGPMTFRVYSGKVSGTYKEATLGKAEVRDFLSKVDSLKASLN